MVSKITKNILEIVAGICIVLSVCGFLFLNLLSVNELLILLGAFLLIYGAGKLINFALGG